MQRQGECNLCGQCCGSNDSPHQHNPWPGPWPEGMRNWQYADFEMIWPYLGMVGLAERPGGGVDVVQVYGNHNLKGNKIYWRWVPGHALCKNLEPYDDPDTYSLECPWLLPDPGDGTRPCAFIGSRFEDLWRACTMCSIAAPLENSAEDIAEWEWRHPACSYWWE